MHFIQQMQQGEIIGRPWEPMGMTTKKWMQIIPTLMPLHLLRPSQTHYCELDVRKNDSSYCGDPIIHVVDWFGCFYVNDGHNRVIKAWYRGEENIYARIFKQ